jgi:L-fucose isomerase
MFRMARQDHPADVSAKILQFARAGLAVATMRGKSYLGMGGVSMGIAGSIVDQPFFESHLGMRVETIDTTEFLRRMDRGIFDQAEYKKALKWVKENCQKARTTIRPRQPAPARSSTANGKSPSKWRSSRAT